MRGILLAATLLVGALSQKAWCQSDPSGEGWKAQGAQTWGGIDALNDSSLIKDEDAQDAANVLTDNGYLEKRPGNVRIATILPGYAVKLVQEWVAPSATKYLVAHASDTIYQTVLNGSVVAVSTVTHGQNVSMAAAFGNIYVADGSAPLWYWNGTSTASVTGSPICTFIDFANERIYCGNVPNESSSEVRVSSFGSASYWTVPSNVSVIGDAPNVFSFQKDDGESITCMKATPWGMFVGKRHSTHILKGFDNLTYYLRVIDPNIGCVDNRTVQIVNGNLIWLGLDGIYTYNGTGQPVLLTRNLDPLIKKIRQLNSTLAQWIIDVLPDWQSGLVSDAGRAWDPLTIPGSIIPSSTTFFDASTTTFYQGTFTNTTSYADASSAHVTEVISSNVIDGGNFVTSSRWQTNGHGSIVTDGSTFSCNGSNVVISCPKNAAGVVDSPCAAITLDDSGITCGTFGGLTAAYSAMTMFAGNSGGAEGTDNAFTSIGGQGYVSDRVSPISNVQTSTSSFICFTSGKNGCASLTSGITSSSATPAGWNVVYDAQVNCQNVSTHACVQWTYANVRVSSYAPTATFVSRTFDTTFSTPTFNPATEYISSDSLKTLTFKEQTSRDGSAWSSTALSQGAQPASKNRYWRYEADFTTNSGTTTASMQSFASASNPLVAVETGTWDSPVHFIGNQISAWKQMNVTIGGDNGVQYYVRGDTNPFSQNQSTPSWTSQSNNSIIVISTETYFQFRIDSSSVTSSTQTEQIDRAAINWQEGGNYPMASGYNDRRYYLCVELSSTTSTNDTCLVMQKNGKWVKWTGPSIASLGHYETDLVMGSAGTDSNVWKVMQPNVYSDDGSPINSYWITKDWSDGLVFNNKILHEMWVDASSVITSSVTVSYAPDKANNFVDKVVPIDGASLEINKRIPLDAGTATSKYFRLKFGSDTSTDYFRVNDYLLYLEDLNRMTDPQ